MDERSRALTRWAPVAGRWNFEDDLATYLGPEDPASPFPHGIALGEARLRSGSVETTVHFSEEPAGSSGRILFGYNAATTEYYSIGLGGYGFAYVLSEYQHGKGWRGVRVAGSQENIAPDSQFRIKATVQGQRVSLIVDGIQVFEHDLSQPPSGDQIGLYAWGPEPVEFKAARVVAVRPEVFVVMQFGEPFDALYTDVIKPVVEEMGLRAYRADDIYRPGIILQDIIRGLIEAEVIIAEITPPNPNVFYELGYAHALDKTTILLAERSKELPFDIRSYRCIFYDNTIRGKGDVERNLRKHLVNILGGLWARGNFA